MGKHAGGISAAPTLNPTALLTGPRYVRDISGGYVILAKNIPATPFSAVVKYD